MSLITPAPALLHPVFPWESGGLWGWGLTLALLAVPALGLYLLVRLVRAIFKRR